MMQASQRVPDTLANTVPTGQEVWHPGIPGQAPDPALSRALQQIDWQWPAQPVLFISDPHADAQALQASLLASGGVAGPCRSGEPFKLTDLGRSAHFVIGGDCLDKGPSNLGLLRCLRQLIDSGARVKLLAGNHDLRLLMGLRALDQRGDPCHEHLFLRMGAKAVPLLQEVFLHYVDAAQLQAAPGEAACRAAMIPDAQWEARFAATARGQVPAAIVAKEISGIQRKRVDFISACQGAGMGMREAYAAAKMCQRLFLRPQGEFAWFFRSMQLAWRSGSFLFLHAGVDDALAGWLAQDGLDALNRRYQAALRGDLFRFYHGPLANALRTKYRPHDLPLTACGLADLKRAGIQAVVHGHRSNPDGQRIMLRQGLIHFEGDITLNRNSRRKLGLQGCGVGVTIISPEGRLIGLSRDYPRVKLFAPGARFH